MDLEVCFLVGFLLWRTRIFPWQAHTDPHDSINKGVNTYPYILQTL